MISLLNPQTTKSFLSELLKTQQPEVVRATAMAAVKAGGSIKRLFLEQASKYITNNTCIDEICGLWVETRSPDLMQLMLQNSWIACAPDRVRVLTTLACQKGDLLQDEAFEMIPHLLNALRDQDSNCVRQATNVLLNLKESRAKEELCRLVIDDHHKDAWTIVKKAGYLPRAPERRALFFLVTGQLDRFEALDFDLSLLRAIYLTADDRLRRNIALLIQKTGRPEYLQAISPGSKEFKISDFREVEWETVWSVLTSAKRCEDIWSLVKAAPTRQSLRFFQYLLAQGWKPESSVELMLFTEIKQVFENEKVNLSSQKPPYKTSNIQRGRVHLINQKGSKMLISRSDQGTGFDTKDHFFLVDEIRGQEQELFILKSYLSNWHNFCMTADEKYLVIRSKGEPGGFINKIIEVDTGKTLKLPEVSKKVYKGQLKWLPNTEAIMLLGTATDFVGLWSLPEMQMISGGYTNPEENHYSWEINRGPSNFFPFVSPDGRRYLHIKDKELSIWSLPDFKKLSSFNISLDRYETYHEKNKTKIDVRFVKDQIILAYLDGYHQVLARTFFSLPDGSYKESTSKQVMPGDYMKFIPRNCSLGLSPDGHYLLISEKGTFLYPLDGNANPNIPTVASDYFFNEEMSLLIEDTDDDCFSVRDLKHNLIITEICNPPNHYSKFLFHPSQNKFFQNTEARTYSERGFHYQVYDIGVDQWFSKSVYDLVSEEIAEMERLSANPSTDPITVSWIRYTLALHRNLHRFDIDVEEVRKVSIGEFDIML